MRTLAKAKAARGEVASLPQLVDSLSTTAEQVFTEVKIADALIDAQKVAGKH